MELVYPDQINAVANHDGLYDGTQLNHPRASHNLLGYKTKCISFTKQYAPSQWVGRPAPEWPERYALFRQYHILNKDVQVENKKKGIPAVIAPVEKSHKREKHRAVRMDMINPLVVAVAEGTSAPTEGAAAQGTSLAPVATAEVT